MENVHPQLLIDVVSQAHRERIESALALANAGVPNKRGVSPRAALASALVALAERVAPGTHARQLGVNA